MGEPFNIQLFTNVPSIKISKTLDINYNDHTLLKINTNDYLKKDNLNLNEDKQKYNDIVNSLLNEGLL